MNTQKPNPATIGINVPGAPKRAVRRAVIYARYSDDKQRLESIADQIEVCRRYAEQQGWHVIALYEDAAQSGGSRFRPGFQRMLADAQTKRFDIVLCEGIERLSRKLADVADFYDRLQFHQVALYTPAVGQVTQMHIGVMGMMAQMFLSDLRDKTRRGQLGRALAGRIPGGLAYGYDVVPPPPGAKEAGERRINEGEAAIVRRIFADYAAGKSPRQIAHDLNAASVRGPGGRAWGDTTIRGQVDRGTGILNNTLYIGQLSWNRCSYVKDPSTGKHLARVNPADKHETVAVPELRIIDDEVWRAVRARQQEVRLEIGRTEDGNALNRTHRREFLLSGLLTCGCCGGGYTIIGKDRYGCATRRAKGTCDNPRTVTRQHIESRVLSGVKEHLLSPELVGDAIRIFQGEMAAAGKEAGRMRVGLERQLTDTKRSLDGILKAIEAGAWTDTIRDRLTELETRKGMLSAELAALPDEAPAIVLHPTAAAAYEQQVLELEVALNDPDMRQEATDILRGLIAQVVLTPDRSAPDGLAVELHGAVADILRFSGAAQVGTDRVSRRPGKTLPGTSVPGSLLSVVAGTGFEPVTFRL